MSMGGRLHLRTERVEESKRAAHERVDSEGTRFSPIPMRLPVQPPSTHKQREPKPPLHWCVICSAPLGALNRWIQLVLWSEECQRSRLETSPHHRLIRDRRDQEGPMECHRA